MQRTVWRPHDFHDWLISLEPTDTFDTWPSFMESQYPYQSCCIWSDLSFCYLLPRSETRSGHRLSGQYLLTGLCFLKLLLPSTNFRSALCPLLSVVFLDLKGVKWHKFASVCGFIVVLTVRKNKTNCQGELTPCAVLLCFLSNEGLRKLIRTQKNNL